MVEVWGDLQFEKRGPEMGMSKFPPLGLKLKGLQATKMQCIMLNITNMNLQECLLDITDECYEMQTEPHKYIK